MFSLPGRGGQEHVAADTQSLLLAMYNAYDKASIQSTCGCFDDILKKAFDVDPRMLFAWKSYQMMDVETSMLGILKNYSVRIVYDSRYTGGSDLEDVHVDDGDLKIEDVIRSAEDMAVNGQLPSSIRIAARNADHWAMDDEILKQLRDALPAFRTCDASCVGWNGTEWKAVTWTIRYMLPNAQANVMLSYHQEGLRRAAGFVRNYLQNHISSEGDLAGFMKVYLVHNFLAINFHLERCERDEENIVDYEPYTAVGAFKGAANWKGMQQACLLLLQEVKVNAMAVRGYQNQGAGDEHGWILVELEDGWYHMDPACACQNGKLRFNRFMIGDQEMARYYTWNIADYPAAEGCTHDYSEIRGHVIKNRARYAKIDAGLLTPWQRP